MTTIKKYLNQQISHALDITTGLAQSNANVVTSSRPEFGDYQANGVMALAKKLKTNPRKLAARVVSALEETQKSDKPDQQSLVEKYEIAGPGFINIHLNNGALAERANQALLNPALLIPSVDTPQSIVVDYSSPNLAKEMHVGHLRGTIIGDCLSRLLESQGHNVIRQNHVGDWGTQFGMLITHMQDSLGSHDGDQVADTELADLETFYRQAKTRFDQDPQFAERARKSVVQLQGGDANYRRIWAQFIDESLKHCESVYKKLNITLSREHLKPESFYNDVLESTVKTLDEKGLLSLSDGAKCVFLEEFLTKEGEPQASIVQKSDGGYLYATTDLAAAKYRSLELKANRILYVVDARQSLHFQQVFLIAAKAKMVNPGTNFEHIAYGTMMGKDGKPFKTRSGDIVKLIDLLDESVRRAFTLVSQKSPELELANRQEIAEKVGIAAVKYAELSKNRTSDYIFDWSTMLSYEGNTAPYLLYAYARIKSVLKKQQNQNEVSSISHDLENEERQLLVKINQLPEVIDAVAVDCYPNQLCAYLYELAGTFMRFYEACPILKSEDKQRESRLALSSLTATSLKTGLDLLGIETLEQM